MTSTPFNVGLGDGSRLSSRVLRPPGGGHTDIFGGEPEPPRGRRGQAAIQAGQGDEPAKPTNGVQSPTQNGQEAPAQQTVTPEPAQEPVVESKPEPVKESPVADAPKEPLKVDAPKIEAPKRVRVPPGGFSSGLW